MKKLKMKMMVITFLTITTLLTVSTVMAAVNDDKVIVLERDYNKMTLQLKCVDGFLFAILNMANNVQLEQVYTYDSLVTIPARCNK